MDSNKSQNKTVDAKGKIAMLRGLRQVRQFSPEPVPDEVVNDILEVGRWTGSGMNRQPWEFVLVRNQDTLKQIAQEEAAGSHLAGANFAIFILMPSDGGDIETFDEARLTERLMLAAAAHGVGAGIWWVRNDGEVARRVLGIPEERRVRTSIGFGYPSEEAISRPKKPDARKPLSQIVHREKY
ncbi:MAG: nitroreductase family protein [Chloroflexia bacterium]